MSLVLTRPSKERKEVHLYSSDFNGDAPRAVAVFRQAMKHVLIFASTPTVIPEKLNRALDALV
jgi:hypothetical protein